MSQEIAYTLRLNDGTFLMNLAVYYLDEPSFTKTLGHCHHELELNYVKSGKGIYKVDNKEYEVSSGDIFVFNNIEPHDLIISPEEDMVNMVIHFEPQFIWSHEGNSFDYRYLKIFFDRNEGFDNRLNRDNIATQEIKKLFIEIEDEFLKQEQGYDLLVKVNLLTILVYIIRHFGFVPEEKKGLSITRQDIASMRKVMYYIDNHIAEDIKLDDLASIAHLSRYYFSTLFKKCNGISPLEYVLRKRTQRAVDYLKNSNKSIQEIISLCGFNNHANFYSAFKKVTGQIPTYFRAGK